MASRPTTQSNGQAVGPDQFLAAMRTNPFLASRADEPSDFETSMPIPDVESIHEYEFFQLQNAFHHVKTQPKSMGVMVTGGAGVGKSHLLNRFYYWLKQREPHSKSPRACSVYLHNILSAPEYLPRYMLKCIFNRLTEGNATPWNHTPLARLSNALLHSIGEQAKRQNLTKVHVAQAVSMLQSRADWRGLESDVVHALLMLANFTAVPKSESELQPDQKEKRRAALTWLSGDPIDLTQANHLGISTTNADQDEQTVSMRDDAVIESTLRGLAAMAALGGQPFVIIIDQIDNLSSAQLLALSRFLHVIIDHASNTLVISSGVTQSLEAFRSSGSLGVTQEAIPQAAWDRLASYSVQVRPIRQEEALQILESRLKLKLDLFRMVPPIAQLIRRDSLFPLGRTWFDATFGTLAEIRPRALLNAARERWDQLCLQLIKQGFDSWIRSWSQAQTDAPVQPSCPAKPSCSIEELIDQEIDLRIQERIRQLTLEPSELAIDAQNFQEILANLLTHCRNQPDRYTLVDFTVYDGSKSPKPPFQLTVEERRAPNQDTVTSGVTIVTAGGNAASHALHRLLHCRNSPGPRYHPPNHRYLFIAKTENVLLGSTAIQHLNDLNKLGKPHFEQIEITREGYASLSALLDVVRQARSNDLEIEDAGKIYRIREEEVIASHHRRGRYLAHPYLRPFLTEEPSPAVDSAPSVTTNFPVIGREEARHFLLDRLSYMIGYQVKELTYSYLATLGDTTTSVSADVEAAYHKRFQEAAQELHREGRLVAHAINDDLFVTHKPPQANEADESPPPNSIEDGLA